MKFLQHLALGIVTLHAVRIVFASNHEALHAEGVTNRAPENITPKIYMYPLRDFWRPKKRFGDISDSFYGLDQLFPELLAASPYVTTNASEADYFYVNAWLYWRDEGWEVDNLVEEMQGLGPWWDRKGGADHILVVTQDLGRCDVPWPHYPVLANTTFIHHFGRVVGRVVGRVGAECGVNDDLTFNLEGCDAEMVVGQAALEGRKMETCHIPGQDIVVPPVPYEPHPDKPHTQQFKTHYIHPELGDGSNRTQMLFYSGKIDLYDDRPEEQDRPWSDASYSFGGRQTLYRMFGHTPLFAIHSTHTHNDYWRHLTNSLFCVAAAGWGWGGRMKVSVTRGCIPLVVQDGILVEWEEQLPLKEYALRIPLWLAHKTPEILHAFNATGRAAAMGRALDCVWRLHWWRRPHGRAFEMTMCELKRRLVGGKEGGGGAKIELDVVGCRIRCGEGQRWWKINGPDNETVVV